MPKSESPDGNVVWRDELSGRYPPPAAYAEEFELQWKLALDGDGEYGDGPGVSLEDKEINDRVYEWTGHYPDGGFDGPSPGVQALDRPLEVDLIRGRDCIDVGCGMGRWTKVMRRIGARSVLSVDLSDSALRSVGRFNPSILRADIMTIPAEHPELVGRFDFANLWGVAMLTHDPRQAFMSAAATVCAGGAMFLMVYAPGGMAGQPATARKRRYFRELSTVNEKLAYVDRVHQRRWDRCDSPRENVKNQMRRLLRRPRGEKIGVLDMLEPFYTWVIPLEVISDWMRAAGFSQMHVLNESVSSKAAYHVLGRKV